MGENGGNKGGSAYMLKKLDLFCKVIWPMLVLRENRKRSGRRVIEVSRKGVWEEIYIYWVPEWGQK